MDLPHVVSTAAHLGVAMEINCQTDRLDLSDAHARFVREHGGALVISTDAHSVGALATMRWGVTVARRGWLEPDSILNTGSLESLRASLRRHRSARTSVEARG
jgi:DNA polymerase (family 10)